MDPKNFQDELHAAMRARLIPLLSQHLDYLDVDASHDQRQKYIEWAVKALGAEAEKKTQSNGYATVIVNIGSNGSISVAAGQQIPDAEEVEFKPVLDEPVALPEPTADMRLASIVMDQDVLDLLSEC